jgi:segregation and condensation protein B
VTRDERPDSLAAQAASWVPPWERVPRLPDRGYAAAAAEPDISDDIDAEPVPQPTDPADGFPAASQAAAATAGLADGFPSASQAAAATAGLADGFPSASEAAGAITSPARAADEVPDGDEDESELSDDDDDFAEAFEGPDPGGVPPELAPLPGEAGGAATVDAPRELPGEAEPDPTDVGGGPEVPVPPGVEEAAEDADEDPDEAPVDAPLHPDDDVLEHDAGDEVGERQAAGDGAGPGRGRAGSPIPAQGRGSAGETRTVDDRELRAALEAILLVVDEPVGELQLAQIVEQPAERVAAALDDISARYTAAGHGFDLRRAAGGWRLYTRPEYAAYVERFVLDGQSVRLTQAALETLAVIAYKQPVARSRISAIRGVNCDGVMRTLVSRGLIEECGTEAETGAFLYRTTTLFLEKLGLNSVDQLPPLAPFLPDDVEEVLDAPG